MSPADLFLDAVAALQAIVEADQVPVRILAFDRAQGWRDAFPFPFFEKLVRCVDSGVVGGVQVPGAVAAPGAWGVGGFVDWRAFPGRPSPLVLRSTSSGTPRLSHPTSARRPARWPRSAAWSYLLRGNRHAQVGVILLPMAGLGLDAAASAGPAGRAALVVAIIWALIRRQFAIIGAVDSHRTSQSPCAAGANENGACLGHEGASRRGRHRNRDPSIIRYDEVNPRLVHRPLPEGA